MSDSIAAITRQWRRQWETDTAEITNLTGAPITCGGVSCAAGDTMRLRYDPDARTYRPIPPE